MNFKIFYILVDICLIYRVVLKNFLLIPTPFLAYIKGNISKLSQEIVKKGFVKSYFLCLDSGNFLVQVSFLNNTPHLYQFYKTKRKKDTDIQNSESFGRYIFF